MLKRLKGFEVTELSWIGKGMTSQVFKGRYKGELVAIKVTERNSDKVKKFYSDYESIEEGIQKEFIFLLEVKSDHVIQFKDFQKTKKFFFSFYEYCFWGDLRAVLHQLKVLPEETMQNIGKQILAGLH